MCALHGVEKGVEKKKLLQTSNPYIQNVFTRTCTKYAEGPISTTCTPLLLFDSKIAQVQVKDNICYLRESTCTSGMA